MTLTRAARQGCLEAEDDDTLLDPQDMPRLAGGGTSRMSDLWRYGAGARAGNQAHAVEVVAEWRPLSEVLQGTKVHNCRRFVAEDSLPRQGVVRTIFHALTIHPAYQRSPLPGADCAGTPNRRGGRCLVATALADRGEEVPSEACFPAYEYIAICRGL